MPTVLWWGRFDPGYSRNRILRSLLGEMGWRIVDFRPTVSAIADVETHLRRLPRPDLVWVPCFRQRDLAAARRWSHARGLPLLFDPLISAYDKQVHERGKFPPSSRQAKRLLAWERGLFHAADLVLADTPVHAEYYQAVFDLNPDRLKVVYVGAEESLFHPLAMPRHAEGGELEVLFYGSFIALQGPQTIIEAARCYEGPAVRWTLLGAGPLRKPCEDLARGQAHVSFEDWLPYADLPRRIHQADIVLGVFGTSDKAARVIPNKVFQALACGRPVITRHAAAYPPALQDRDDSGLVWVGPGNPRELARAVSQLASDADSLELLGQLAHATYRAYFCREVIAGQLAEALSALA